VIRRRVAIAVALAAWVGAGVPATQAQSLGLADGEVLRGRFTQQRFLQGFNGPLTSSGSFIVAPGRGIVWRGEAPFALVTVMGPGGLTQRVAGGATTHYPASRLPPIARLYEIFAAALGGDWQKLTAVFDVRREGTANDWTVTLTPLRSGEGGLPLRQVVVRGSRYVDSVEVARVNGDRDRIDFSQQAPSRAPIDAESNELLDSAGRP
jgi:Outer membrane lipoprotein carrier protein LolA-like